MKKEKFGLLTNQSAFTRGMYHFEVIQEKYFLHTLFLPEHGLFAELQDQVSGSNLKYEYGDVKIVNLYGDDENSLLVKDTDLENLDVIVFDISDIGARYYTFLTSCFYILQSVSSFNSTNKKKINIIVYDKKNPIGKKIEGSPLQKQYSSFVGVESVLHRHGLSIYQLMEYYNREFSLGLNIIRVNMQKFYREKSNSFLWVPPSPNIPTLTTCYAYVGQCLLEGTNLSEGRGTTKPFEIFGAPFINIQDKALLKELGKYQSDNFYLRPLIFMPTFHKYKNELCGGFQLMIRDSDKFDSLLFSLHFIKTIQEFYPEQFQFLSGVYEFRSDKSAIELLAGDDKILEFLKGKGTYKQIQDYFRFEEKVWKKKLKKLKLL
jgi:uncharacterized protein YbbC (DUF1343 family)